jgi:hypothetical protein
MATDASQNATSEGSPSKPRRRSSARMAFPRVGIAKAEQLVKAVWELGLGDEVRTIEAFAPLGWTPTSGSSRTLLATANGGYGLVKGSKDNPRIALTERGKQLADGDTEGRLRAIHDALFSNPIFSGIHQYYLDKPLPAESVVVDKIRELGDLSADDASVCWTVMRENLVTAGLLTTSGKREVIISRDEAFEEIPIAQDTAAENDREIEANDIRQRQRQRDEESESPRGRLRSLPQVVFNVQIQLPESASAETYDTIFSSLSKHLIQLDDE